MFYGGNAMDDHDDSHSWSTSLVQPSGQIYKPRQPPHIILDEDAVCMMILDLLPNLLFRPDDTCSCPCPSPSPPVAWASSTSTCRASRTIAGLNSQKATSTLEELRTLFPCKCKQANPIHSQGIKFGPKMHT
jgi:hypothetical protein